MFYLVCQFESYTHNNNRKHWHRRTDGRTRRWINVLYAVNVFTKVLTPFILLLFYLTGKRSAIRYGLSHCLISVTGETPQSMVLRCKHWEKWSLLLLAIMYVYIVHIFGIERDDSYRYKMYTRRKLGSGYITDFCLTRSWVPLQYQSVFCLAVEVLRITWNIYKYPVRTAQ